MLYGAAQAGGNSAPGLNVTAVSPGDSVTLLDGTEVIVSGSKSVSFRRANSLSGDDSGITFDVSGCPNNSVIDIQAANQDLEASYFKVGTVTLVAGSGGYTDIGRSAYYRAVVTTFQAGDKPVVIAQR